MLVNLLSIVFISLVTLPTSTAIEETVKAGNYSFSFNLTVPYQVEFDDPDMPECFTVKTFDGHVWICDWSWANLTREDHESPDAYSLGWLTKNIPGEGRELAHIWASELTGDPGFPQFSMTSTNLTFQSTMNLTQSIDFFRSVEITRISDDRKD